MVTRCRLAALAFSVAFVGSLPTAFAAGFTAECVSDYSIYGAGSVPANCASASGLVSTLTGGGHSNTSFWTDYDVWDTDMVDLSVYAYGGDYNYTDRADARLYYFAGHGQCNYGKEVSGPPCSGGSCAPGLSCELGHCIKHCSKSASVNLDQTS